MRRPTKRRGFDDPIQPSARVPRLQIWTPQLGGAKMKGPNMGLYFLNGSDFGFVFGSCFNWKPPGIFFFCVRRLVQFRIGFVYARRIRPHRCSESCLKFVYRFPIPHGFDVLFSKIWLRLLLQHCKTKYYAFFWNRCFQIRFGKKILHKSYAGPRQILIRSLADPTQILRSC